MVPAFFEIFMAMIGAMMSGASILAQDQANNQNITLARDTLTKQQQFSQESAEAAQQRQIDMYKEFFTPSAMMKQYKEAGLNPSLMYAKGGVGGSSSAAPMAATPAATIPYINPLIGQGQMGEMMNVIKTMTEAQRTKSETELNEWKVDEIEATISEKQANVELIEEKAKTEVLTQLNTKLDADLKEIEKKYQEETLENRVKLVAESLNLMIAQEENLWTEIAGKEIDNKWKDALYTAEKELKEAQKNLFIAQKVVPAAQATLMEAQAALADAQKGLAEAQKDKVAKEAQELQYMLEDMEKLGWKATKSNDIVSQMVGVICRIYELITGENLEVGDNFRGFGETGHNKNRPFEKGKGGGGTW